MKATGWYLARRSSDEITLSHFFYLLIFRVREELKEEERQRKQRMRHMCVDICADKSQSADSSESPSHRWYVTGYRTLLM